MTHIDCPVCRCLRPAVLLGDRLYCLGQDGQPCSTDKPYKGQPTKLGRQCGYGGFLALMPGRRKSFMQFISPDDYEGLPTPEPGDRYTSGEQRAIDNRRYGGAW